MSERLLRLPEVERRTGLRKSAVYAWIRAGKFPAPLRLGTRSSAWLETEIENFIGRQIRASRGDG